MLIVTPQLYEQIKNILDARNLLMKAVNEGNIAENDVIEMINDAITNLLTKKHRIDFMFCCYAANNEIYVTREDGTQHLVKVMSQAAFFTT